MPAATSPVASVEVSVPANAEIWFDGDRTNQVGAMRTFRSPPLLPGKTYQYEVRARWLDNGKVMEQKVSVEVQAGGRAQVRFGN
jgi:uncharacterized protein (TIGR03000 family)